MMNFLFCTVLPPGASKVDQTHKFDDFLNLIQLFPITPYSVLVEITVVRNYVMNNFKLHDKALSPYCTVLPPEVSKVDKTHKFYDFFYHTQFFQIRQKSVLIEMKVFRNFVINKFKLNDKLSRMHSFHSKSL